MKKTEKLKNVDQVTASSKQQENTSNDDFRISIKLELNKETIANLNPDDTGGGGTARIRLSLFNWVDCGAHSPHWCNTACAGRRVRSMRLGNTDTDDCD